MARTPSWLPLLAVVAAVALPASGARAQELAVPAVDDSPSAQLLVEQALDQSKANPREAVRLLAQALDADPARLVRAGTDADLFVTVARRVHSVLAADAALRAAFRRELDPDAEERFARGEFDGLVERRLDTSAGVRACIVLAERALVRGRFAATRGLVDRLAGHDLLQGALAEQVARLSAECARGLAGPAGDPLADGTFDASFASTRWGETWRVGFDGGAATALQDDRPRATDASLPRSVPAIRGDRVFVSDGSAIRAFDRLGGRALWTVPLDGSETLGPLRLVGAGPDSVIGFASSFGAARGAQSRVLCIDPSSGAVRFESRLDRLGAPADLEGVAPQGAPLVVDGRIVTSAHRTSPRLETVSWLVCVDPSSGAAVPWARAIATTGSVRVGSSRMSESPVLCDGVLYLATATGAVAAVDPWDGFVRWVRRFPVPVRDVNARAEAIDVTTPAVVGGRVLAVTPDRTRIVALGAADGRVLAEVPTAADGGQPLPTSLLGDPSSGLVIALGDRIACFHAEDPSSVLWTTKDTDRVSGRARFAATKDPASPVVVVPLGPDLVVLDARSGAERLRLAGAGTSNAACDGSQVVVAGTASLSGWMPVAEAERIVRARMKASESHSEALALLGLARQVRSGAMAAEAARESVRRARNASEAVRSEVLELLVAADELELAEGADRAALDAAVDEAAVAAGQSVRGEFVKARRALRRGDARTAAGLAARAALAAPEGTLLPTPEGLASPEAECRRIAELARAADARAEQSLDSAVASSIGSPAGPERARVLRTAARVGAGTPAGDRALAALAAAADPAGRRAAIRLARECVALGAKLQPATAAALGTAADALRSSTSTASIDGELRRAVECSGRLPRMAAAADPLRGGFLAIERDHLVFRAAPSYAARWSLAVGSEDFGVVSTSPDIVVCDDARGGTGRVTCISPDGTLRWAADPDPPAPRAPDADDPDVDERRRLRGVGAVAFATADSVTVLGGDGGLTGFGRERGDRRWHRAPAGMIAAWAHEPAAIAIAEVVEDTGGAAVRISVIDPVDGSGILSWTCELATEVRWMRFVAGGLLVVGTDDGIEARRIAGGDEAVPLWTLDSVDARESARGWAGLGLVAVLDRFDALRVLGAWTGRWIGEPGDRRMRTPAREVLWGDGWFAGVHDDGVEFFDARGVPSGRDAPGTERAIVSAGASARRLFLLDAGVEGSDPVPMRFAALVRDLDAGTGGMEGAPPVAVRMLGQRPSSLRVIDGGLAVSNGSSIQVLEFSSQPPPSGR